jgi:hypothetical protein
MPSISVRRTIAADRPILERLWLMFRHDMSEFGGQLPNPDGTFRTERLVAAFEDRDWSGYVIAGPEDRPADSRSSAASLAQPVSSTASSWCGRCGELESGCRLCALSSLSIPARGRLRSRMPTLQPCTSGAGSRQNWLAATGPRSAGQCPAGLTCRRMSGSRSRCPSGPCVDTLD